MTVQSRWEDQRDRDCAEHNQPKCESFPDCSCPECHKHHVEEHEFNDYCGICDDERCPKCGGRGWAMIGRSECLQCRGRGRILLN